MTEALGELANVIDSVALLIGAVAALRATIPKRRRRQRRSSRKGD